ncbi:AAA family ATPase [Serratia marcescens]
MSKVLFKKIAILSLSERKAFNFNFSEGINFIHGTNDTGKSSLIKSLYYCLGGDLRLDDSWKSQDIIIKLTISYDKRTINFFRKSSTFVVSIFENNQIKSEKVFTKTSALAAEIQDIFGFNLLLTLKKNKETVLANPATLYFPFYIDQDDGWSHVLESFSGLKMYDNWQKNALQYHSGIKPKEYYALSGEQKVLAAQIAELEQEAALIRKTKFRFEQHFKDISFDIDINFYIEKIDYFVKKCEELELEERAYRLKAMELYSKRSSISDVIFNIENDQINSVIEKNDDISFAIEKYEINKSKISLFSQKTKLYEEKNILDIQISKIKEKLLEHKEISSKIKAMLSDVHNEFSIKEIIDSEAYKSASVAFDNQLSEIKTRIEKLALEKSDLDSRIKSFNNAKRTKEINTYFLKMLNKAQMKLRLPVSEKGSIISYKTLTTGKTGSRSPRVIFAYHYALLMTINNFSSLPLLPIVIDSPKQQDLDDELTEKLIQFCLDDLAEVSQVIIGAVKPEKNMIGYHSISLNKKFSLLKEEEFEDTYIEIVPIFDNALLELSQ